MLFGREAWKGSRLKTRHRIPVVIQLLSCKYLLKARVPPGGRGDGSQCHSMLGQAVSRQSSSQMGGVTISVQFQRPWNQGKIQAQ